MTRGLICVGALVFLFANGCGRDRDRGFAGGDAGVDAAVDAGPPGPVVGEWTTCEQPPELDCAEPLGDGAPLVIEGDTEEEEDSFGGASCGRAGIDVADAAFQWTAPAAGRWTFSTQGTWWNSMLYVRRNGCGDAEELACNDDATPDVRYGQITLDLEACETVVIVVDGFSTLQRGPFRLTVSGRELSCGDGIDDDGDGLTDCEDPDCFGPSCPGDAAWPSDWVEAEWRVLELTNMRRAAGADCGGEAFPAAGPLEMDETIQIAARLHSRDMGEQGFFAHDSLDGRSFADRMTEAGFTGDSPWGENIAAGQSTAEEVVQGWMDSPGHCRNIMNPAFNVIGIGYAYVDGSSMSHYWTQDFAASH